MANPEGPTPAQQDAERRYQERAKVQDRPHVLYGPKRREGFNFWNGVKWGPLDQAQPYRWDRAQGAMIPKSCQWVPIDTLGPAASALQSKLDAQEAEQIRAKQRNDQAVQELTTALKALPKQADSGIKSQYLAFALDPQSRASLLRQFRPRFKKVICEHITVEFFLTDEKLVVLQEELKDATIEVIGHQTGDGIECLVCSVNGSHKRPDGKTYHITLSLTPPHKPVESNQLIQAQGYQSCIPTHVQAELKLLEK